jgi:ribosomal protein S18 acetylase RimI-like enzyme
MEATSACAVRPMRPEDLPALLDLWIESWQAAYPSINFHARRDWADSRFAELQRSGARILVAETTAGLAGLVTVDPARGYIDQIVVATAAQRRGVASQLIAAARGVSPTVLELHVNQDNAPAVAFYQRRGFAIEGHDANPSSGAPTFRMLWRATP